MSALSRLLRLLRPRWITGLLVLGCIAVLSATTALYAWLAGPLLGALYGAARGNSPSAPDIPVLGTVDTAMELALILSGALVAVAIVRGLASYAQAVWTASLQLGVVRELRIAVYEHLLAVVPGALLAHSRGELGERVSADVQRVESLISVAIAPLVRNGITAIALIVLAFSLDPLLAAVALVGLGPLVWYVARAARRLREAWRRSHDAQARIAGDVSEVAGMVALVRAYEAEGRASRTFGRRVDDAHDTAHRARRWSALLGPVLGVMGAAAAGITVILGTWRLEAGAVSADTYVSFFAAMFFLYRPVQGLGALAGHASAGLAALDRVGAMLELERETADREDASDLPPMEEQLELEGVTFAYGDARVLNGVDLRIRRGESVAIVGPSGEGKTTLLLVLLGILPPTGGAVRIDGRDVAAATRDSLRRQFAWVPQEPTLFADTVLANVALADERPDRARAEACARAAGAHDFISGLSRGYDTNLAEGGADLSVGQRQRICIARALYRAAPVLLLDEPTASLDGGAEAELGRTIEGLLGERTVILVSHRESTIRRADRVLLLSGGRIAEDRRPEELDALPGSVGVSDVTA